MANIELRSSKDFWVLISGSSILRSKELVGSELERNSKRILNGVLYYRPPTSTSSEALHKEKLVEPQNAFLLKLSKLLVVDEIQCYHLYCSYLMFEYKGTHENLQKKLLSERHVHSLLYEVWNYYFNERLYILLSLKQVLSHWQDERHPYKDLYEGFLESINSNNAVVNLVIKQLEVVSSQEMPVCQSQGHDLTENFIYRWVLYNLKEQIELLHILLLFYKDMEPCVGDVLKLLSIFKRCSFGQKLPYRQHINDTLQPLVDYIGLLEGLLLVECFEVEWLHACHQQNIDTEHYLLKDEEALKDLEVAVSTLGNLTPHGPVLLSWMLFGQLSEQQVDVQVHGAAALKLSVFQYLAQALKSPLLSNSSGIVNTLIHSIVYGQVSILLSTFESGALVNQEAILNVAEKVLSFENVANDFWNRGLDDGLGLLLTQTMDVFPWQLSPCLRLCKSLAKATPDSAAKVYDLLCSLKSYAEACDALKDSIPLRDHWQLLKEKRLYGNDAVVLPSGSVGLLLKLTDKSGLPVVQWQAHLDGWQVCLGELQEMLRQASLGAGYVTAELTVRVVSLSQLVHTVLLSFTQNPPQQLQDLAQELCNAMHRFSLLPMPPLSLLAGCLSVQSAFLKSGCYSSTIWQQLAQNNFLPFLTNRPESGETTLMNFHCNVGRMGELVASQEKVSGQYDLLSAFLDLLNNSLEATPTKDTASLSLLGCLVFVLQDVFPSFQKWRYLQHGTREMIGLKCLKIFHKLLMITEKNPPLRLCQQALLQALLHRESGKSLLALVATGDDVIQTAMETQGSQVDGLGQRLTSLVRLSLSVLNRVLLLRHQVSSPIKISCGPSLEDTLFSRQPQGSLLLCVAYYAFQRYDPALATLAVQLLRRMAQEFPMSLLGCLGSEAWAIRDLFLMRLQSSTEDIRLKVAITQFLSTCVAKQPGLIECFLSSKEGSQESDEDDNCLQCILSILEKKESSSSSYMRELRCVCVEFLHSLWAAHQLLAIQRLKQRLDLWDILCQPIFQEGKSTGDMRIMAFVFHTLSLELFHSKGKVDEAVLDVFRRIRDQKLLSVWSKHVCSNFLLEDLENVTQEADFEQGIFHEDTSRNAILLLLAWRDLLLLLTKDHTMEIPKGEKTQILKDVMNLLKSQLSSQDGKPQVSILVSEFYLLLFKEWKSVEWPEWCSSMSFLLEALSHTQQQQQLRPMRLHLALLSAAASGLKSILMQESTSRQSLTFWVVPSCQLVIYSAKDAITATDKDNQLTCMVSLCLLKDLLSLITTESTWIRHLSQHLVLPTLTSLLVSCLKTESGPRLAHTIVTFFLSLVDTPQVAELLCSVDLVPQVTLLLTYNQDGKSSWCSVYVNMVQLVSKLLQSQKHLFLSDVLNFVGTHRERMQMNLYEIQQQPHHKDFILEATQTCSLLYQLADHQKAWRFQHKLSYHSLLMAVCDCCNTAIAYLIKPDLLNHLVKHPAGISVAQKSRTLEAKSGDHESLSQMNMFQEAQNRLMELLTLSLATLYKFSPSLVEILSDQGVDVNSWVPLLPLQGSLGSSSMEQDWSLTFSSLVACISLTLKVHTKNEKTPSPRVQQVEGPRLPIIMELGLSFLLSQLLLRQAQLTDRESQMQRREIGTELNPLVWNLQRSLRRGGSTTSPEKPFLKFICQFVENFFK